GAKWGRGAFAILLALPPLGELRAVCEEPPPAPPLTTRRWERLSDRRATRRCATARCPPGPWISDIREPRGPLLPIAGRARTGPWDPLYWFCAFRSGLKQTQPAPIPLAAPREIRERAPKWPHSFVKRAANGEILLGRH